MIAYVTTSGVRQRLTEGLGTAGRMTMRIAGWITTMVLVGLAWVFFRAATLADAMLVLRRILAEPVATRPMNLHPGLDGTQFAIALALIVGLFVVEAVNARRPMMPVLVQRPRWQRWSAYYAFAVMFALLVLWGPERSAQPFIYFQF
jgi:hypothetical protein